MLARPSSTQSIPDFAYDKYAELLGLKGMVVRDPEQLGAAWAEALAADRPVVLTYTPTQTCLRCRRIFPSKTLRTL